MGKYREYSNDDLIQAVKDSFTLADVLRKLDLKIAGGNYDHLRKNIAQLDLDVSHFTGRVWSKNKSIKDWALYKKSAGRKKYLINERGYKCEDCELTTWKGFPIMLELHHVNGNRLDNRKENLQLLCSNCHATTDNWRGRNINKNAVMAELVDAMDLYKLSDYNESYRLESFKVGEALTDNADGNPEPSPCKGKGVESGRRKPKFCICGNNMKSSSKFCSIECYRIHTKSDKPKVPELLEAFGKYKSYLQVGNFYNVSDNAVRKWVNSYGIQDMVKGHSSTQKEINSCN
jgi:hypothetical protein